MSTPTTAQAMTQAIALDIRLGCYDPGVCLGECTACKRADFILEQQKRIEAALALCNQEFLTEDEESLLLAVRKALEAE